MGVILTDEDGKPAEDKDEFRIPVTREYLEGREAAERGLDIFEASEHITDYYRRLDFFIGHHDFKDGVTVEQRAEAERNGGNV